MSSVDERNILSDASAGITSSIGTRVSARDVLATSMEDEAAIWDDACDRLLAWRSSPDQFDEDDQPAADILETALDYVIDERSRGGSAPTLIVPSGDGRLAFEWHADTIVVIIEFVALGQATYTKFADGEVVEHGSLSRNPRTRRLELGSGVV